MVLDYLSGQDTKSDYVGRRVRTTEVTSMKALGPESWHLWRLQDQRAGIYKGSRTRGLASIKAPGKCFGLLSCFQIQELSLRESQRFRLLSKSPGILWGCCNKLANCCWCWRWKWHPGTEATGWMWQPLESAILEETESSQGLQKAKKICQHDPGKYILDFWSPQI